MYIASNKLEKGNTTKSFEDNCIYLIIISFWGSSPDAKNNI